MVRLAWRGFRSATANTLGLNVSAETRNLVLVPLRKRSRVKRVRLLEATAVGWRQH